MNTDLRHLTIAEGGRLFRARKLSPVEWTKALLDGIASIDPILNAFITVTAERALSEAAEAESELSSGLDRGPFHGIPYGLKDIYGTAGIRTTAHSKLLEEHVPDEDCTVQKKLRAAGGVLLGKQTTWEFALGGPSFDLPWPPARNPWNLERSPMGSSSGAGAAIAIGLCPAATGSDTGGSIRMPATVCGIAGLPAELLFLRSCGSNGLDHGRLRDHAGRDGRVRSARPRLDRRLTGSSCRSSKSQREGTAGRRYQALVH
jgi:aspartyl-tRNA(Asn)/glutamyl-tRNA(Gln) amidotransferase subunit A